MLVKIGLELLSGFVRVEHKLGAGPEGQPADITIRRARSAADVSRDLEIPVWHVKIIAGCSW